MKKLNKEFPVALDLNEIIRKTIRFELRRFAQEHPDYKFRILCDVDEEITDTAREINEYLVENQCSSILSTGGQIIMKNRKTLLLFKIK